MSKPPVASSAARDALRAFAPKFVGLTDDVLFGDVWERPGLSKRDRSLITCATLIALNRTEQQVGHFQRALHNGVTKDEIIEMIHEQFDVPVERIKTEESLLLDLGVDSLDVIELIMNIEEKYSVEIPDELAEKIHNIGDIISYVEEYVGARQCKSSWRATTIS